MRAAQIDNQRGFSLIEALVSLIVISVGMIGIAALYNQGLGASRTALYRTQAVNLAADMADRIRSNKIAGIVYDAAGADSNCDPSDNRDCTPAEMARHDKWLWTTQVAAQLPNGVGRVGVAPTDPPTYTIVVEWQEVGIGAIDYQIAVQIPNL